MLPISENPSELPPGRLLGTVIQKLPGAYWVRLAGGQSCLCAISNKLRKQLVYPIAASTSVRRRVMQVKELDDVDPIAIGDQVSLADAGADNAGQPRGLITGILPRRNSLTRCSAVPMPGARPFEQMVAANVDQVLIVCPAGQAVPRRWVLDQYLAAAEAARLPARICLTKLDLADEGLLADELALYQAIGYEVLPTSARTGAGLDSLRRALTGRVSVLLGKSGVGKTSLLNALQPGLGLRIREVNKHTHEGRHATTSSQMFDLAAGGSVVDTPGQREFRPWGLAQAAVDQLFPEMRPFLGQCKFGADCAHAHEPGCAVKAALATGRIAESRYANYLRLAADQS